MCRNRIVTETKKQASLTTINGHPKVIRNLPGTNSGRFENQSSVWDKPGCSLTQGASSWNEAPAGAAPARKIGIWLCMPPHSAIYPSHIQSVHLATAGRERTQNSRRPEIYPKKEAARSSPFDPALIWLQRLERQRWWILQKNNRHWSGIQFPNRN